MGLDLYITAKITEKKTGGAVSGKPYPPDMPPFDKLDADDREYYAFEYDCCEICWCCGWSMQPVRKGIIDICNKFTGRSYTENDFDIFFPKEALREIYGFLVKNAYIKDETPFEREQSSIERRERSSYEITNLKMAEKLHDLITMLEIIDLEGKAEYISDEITFKDESDREKFKKAPKEYEWEFLFFNSY